MRIDRSEVIAGQPVKKVRDFLRRLGNLSWSAGGIAEYFAIDLSAVAELITELCQRNLLEKAEPWREDTRIFYQQGPSAPRLATANLLKPISRERADDLVKELLNRVESINADDNLVYEVAEVRLFGSYLDSNRQNVGDVDLAVKLVPRGGKSDQTVDLSLARAAASGRRFSNFLDQQLCYGEREVLSLLKARKPHLSIHMTDDLHKIGADSRVIFPRSSGDG